MSHVKTCDTSTLSWRKLFNLFEAPDAMTHIISRNPHIYDWCLRLIFNQKRHFTTILLLVAKNKSQTTNNRKNQLHQHDVIRWWMEPKCSIYGFIRWEQYIHIVYKASFCIYFVFPDRVGKKWPCFFQLTNGLLPHGIVSSIWEIRL
jgi:hypothetical protein